MKSHISKVRIAALAVGLAIVMSSCGIQNQAGDSSSASGKTKNFALLADGQFCYDTVEEQEQAHVANEMAHMAWHMNPTNEEAHIAFFENTAKIWGAQIGACPAPATPASDDDVVAVAARFTCVRPEEKQAMIDGYKEQIAKTDYSADWTTAMIADYQDQMKRGLAIAEIICTSDK